MELHPVFWKSCHHPGRIILLLLVFGYILLYILNILLPLDFSFPFQYPNLTSRIWSWTELLLGTGAILILIMNRSEFSKSAIFRGIILGIISGTSLYAMNQSQIDGILTGFLVLVCYVSALTMNYSRLRVNILSFQESYRNNVRLILYGILISLPFACINLWYFYQNYGLKPSPGMMNAAFLACNPAISEEIIFRFFPVILTLVLLRNEPYERLSLFAAICIGVIPHSLNHLPDLFMVNPLEAVILCILTSLLFGLPMCLLQLFKGLPSASGFHWFVDMTRFLFGY